MIYRRAAAEHSHGIAATEHVAQAARESAGHFAGHASKEAAAIHLGHHLLHLLVLAKKLIDLAYGRARAACDTRLAASIDKLRSLAFLTRHRTDDRLGTFELRIDLDRLLVGDRDAAGELLGQHLHQ